MELDKISTNSLRSGEPMQTPEMVEKILNLSALGWGKKRIAKELGTTRKTVTRYLRQKGWLPYQRPRRQKKLEGLEKWLEETFLRHRGNAAVVRQELQQQHNIHLNPEPLRELSNPSDKSWSSKR